METRYYYDLFVKRLKEYFDKDISAGCEFDYTEGIYKVWHNYENFDDIEFRKALGKCIKEVFYANNIFDYYITYEKHYELSFNSMLPAITYGYENIQMKIEKFLLPIYLMNKEVKYDILFLDDTIELTSQKIMHSKYIESGNIYREGDFAA